MGAVTLLRSVALCDTLMFGTIDHLILTLTYTPCTCIQYITMTNCQIVPQQCHETQLQLTSGYCFDNEWHLGHIQISLLRIHNAISKFQGSTSNSHHCRRTHVTRTLHNSFSSSLLTLFGQLLKTAPRQRRT